MGGGGGNAVGGGGGNKTYADLQGQNAPNSILRRIDNDVHCGSCQFCTGCDVILTPYSFSSAVIRFFC